MTDRIPWLEEQYQAGRFQKCELEAFITMDRCHASTIFLAEHQDVAKSGGPSSEGITTSTVRGYGDFGWDMLPVDEKKQVIYESALLEVEFAELGSAGSLARPVLEWEQNVSILGRYFFHKLGAQGLPKWKFCFFLPRKQMREFSEISRSGSTVLLDMQVEVYATDEPVVAGVDPDILLPVPQCVSGRGRFNIVRVTSITCEHDEPFVPVVL